MSGMKKEVRSEKGNPGKDARRHLKKPPSTTTDKASKGSGHDLGGKKGEKQGTAKPAVTRRRAGAIISGV